MLKFSEIDLKNNPELVGFITVRKKSALLHAKQMHEPFQVETPEGIMLGNAGDYIIKGVSNELYPCKKELFERTYEIIE